MLSLWAITLFGAAIGAGAGTGYVIAETPTETTTTTTTTTTKAAPKQSAPARVFKCPHCGKPVATDQKFCGLCGQDVSAEASKFCPNCGSENPDNASFCVCCGAPLPGKTVSVYSHCPDCGAAVREGETHCVKCGKDCRVQQKQKTPPASGSGGSGSTGGKK